MHVGWQKIRANIHTAIQVGKVIKKTQDLRVVHAESSDQIERIKKQVEIWQKLLAELREKNIQVVNSNKIAKAIGEFEGNNYKYLFVEDRERNIQGIGVFCQAPWMQYKSVFQMNYLMTAPSNLVIKENEGKAIRGAGTLLVREMVRTALVSMYTRVEVVPYLSAIPFYERLGFEREALEYILTQARVAKTWFKK